MKVCANVSKEVADYYKNYDLDKVVDIMLGIYDITTLPPVDKSARSKRVQLTIDITNEEYISLYKFYGSRSVKISIARLLDFGYNMLVLDNIAFEFARKKVTDEPVELNQDYNIVKALEYLQMEYDLHKNIIVKQTIDILKQYRKIYNEV